MKSPVTKLIVAILIFFMLLVGCAVLFSGCKVAKHKRLIEADSVSVSKRIDTSRTESDSGGLLKILDTSSHLYSGQRWTIQPSPGVNVQYLPYFLKPNYPAQNDTVVGYQYLQPTIIYEQWQGLQQNRSDVYDSAWQKSFEARLQMAIDSMASNVKLSDKNKASTGPGFFEYIGIAALLIALVSLLLKYKRPQ